MDKPNPEELEGYSCFTVWLEEEFNAPNRGEGWEIPGFSQGEDGPAWAIDAEDAAKRWAWKRYRQAPAPGGEVICVVMDSDGAVTRWSVSTRLVVEVNVCEADSE